MTGSTKMLLLILAMCGLAGFAYWSTRSPALLDTKAMTCLSPCPSTLSPISFKANMTFSQPYRFTTDETLSQHGKVFSFWLEAVAEKKNGRFTYLEVGRLEGRSALWVADSFPYVQVVTVDKTEHPNFADNLRLSPSKERIVVTNSPSFPALHQLFQTRRTFDVIYIDGAHDARTVIEDAVIAWPLLNPDGVMIFDSYPEGGNLAPKDTVKPAVDFFLFAYQNELKVRHCDWSVIVQKSAV